MDWEGDNLSPPRLAAHPAFGEYIPAVFSIKP